MRLNNLLSSFELHLYNDFIRSQASGAILLFDKALSDRSLLYATIIEHLQDSSSLHYSPGLDKGQNNPLTDTSTRNAYIEL